MRLVGWGVTILAAIGVVAVLGFQLFKTTIAERAMARSVAKTVTADAVRDLPDGLHVYLCGTGGPMPDPVRAGPCIGVLAGNQAFVFDVGSGSVRKLGRMGFPWDALQKVYLTHLHSDHLDGLGEMMLQAWVAGGRSAPLPIAGPEGVVEVVGGFNQVYRRDSTFRIAHHGTEVANPLGFGGEAETITVPAGPPGVQEVYNAGGVRVSAIRVQHAPVEPAFGYRIDYGGRSIAISGDTVYHPEFVAASEGVDIMLHDALDPEMAGVIGGALAEAGDAVRAKIFTDILDYHATPEDAARAAEAAGARELVIYHLVPPVPVKLVNGIFLGDAEAHFDGRLTLGEDGMRISLPAGSDEVIHARAY